MLPLWIESLRDRAQLYVDAARPLLRDDSERGLGGMKTLIASVDAWVFEDSAHETVPLDEARFVEAAGAMLALLLLDHIGDGEQRSRDGKHRVKLGAFGFFDPFTTLTGAIEAKNPARYLRDCVEFAEREARGEGPVSRVVKAFARVLEEERPDMRIVDQFDARLWLASEAQGEEAIEVDLHRAVIATSDQRDSAVDQAVSKIAAMLPGGAYADGIPWDEAKTCLVPRIVASTFAPPSGSLDALATTSWIGGLRIALLLSFEGRSRFVRRNELDKWGVSFDDALRAALVVLAARSAGARWVHTETPDGTLVIAKSGDGLDAARVLLPAVYDVLSAALGRDVLIGLPHRDTLYACAGGSEDLERTLRAKVADDSARAPHRISEALFALGPDGLRPLA
jgi:uncharacterized protein YtpQ (UPF0354 family)